MPLKSGQPLAALKKRALEPQHLPCGVPGLPPLVLTQRDELVGGPHLEEGRLELLGAIGLGVEISGEIPLGEGRLALGHGSERDPGVLEDPPPVLGGDRFGFGHPLGEISGELGLLLP
ncbi:MAG: hypothetical protein ACRD1A_12775, partial [Terriglobales bacterium]